MKLYSDYIYENEMWDEYIEDTPIYEGLILNGIKKLLKKLFHIKGKKNNKKYDDEYDNNQSRYDRYSGSYTSGSKTRHMSKLSQTILSGRFTIDDSCKAYDKVKPEDIINDKLYTPVFLNIDDSDQKYNKLSTKVYKVMVELIKKATDNYKNDYFPYFIDRYCKNPRDIDLSKKSYFFEILSKETEDVNVPLSVASLFIDNEQENSDEDKLNIYIDIDFINGFDDTYTTPLKTLYTITINDLINSIKKLYKNEKKPIKLIYKTNKTNTERIKPILKNAGFIIANTALIKNI